MITCLFERCTKYFKYLQYISHFVAPVKHLTYDFETPYTIDQYEPRLFPIAQVTIPSALLAVPLIFVDISIHRLLYTMLKNKHGGRTRGLRA